MSARPLDLTADELREGLTACLNVPRWVDDVVAAGPYATLDQLLEVARAAATPLRPEEIEQALADHPRIGEQLSGHGQAQSFSAAEQASSASTDDDLAQRLAAGNAAYEAKFGRIFLIRAAGRSRAEIVAELERRLALDPEIELEIIGSELRDIALLRISRLFARDRSRVTTHVLDAVSGRPASGVAVTLEHQAVEGWQPIASGQTDDDGRIADLGPKELNPGVYRVRFATGAYFASQGSNAFYPEVMILFTLDDADAHYHVPLLLSPYAYSTYRGS